MRMIDENRINQIRIVLEQRLGDYPPTLREIGAKTGISSASMVGYYLKKMEERGMIKRDKGAHRGIVLL